MSTLKQLVDSTLHIISGGRRSDDELPEEKLIEYFWFYQRALFARRDIERNGWVSSIYEQDLGCVELEIVDRAECCELEADCDILRTVNKIPRLIRLNRTEAFTYVGAIDKYHNYQVIDPITVGWQKYNKFTGKLNKAYYKNDYMYVLTNNNLLKYINIRGVFFDPIQAGKFVDCDDKCFTADSEFPLPDDMIDGIMKQLLNGELRIMSSIPTDLTNDAKDNIQQGDKL